MPTSTNYPQICSHKNTGKSLIIKLSEFHPRFLVAIKEVKCNCSCESKCNMYRVKDRSNSCEVQSAINVALS